MTLAKLITLLLTAVVIIPSGAHLFELPGKIDLDRDAYFTVQGIYAGWSYFALPIIGAIVANAVLAAMLRKRAPGPARWAALSSLLIVASLVVFFAWVFPANRETVNWTVQPDDWEVLRRHWEYGHAVDAVIVFLAFLATAKATITWAR